MNNPNMNNPTSNLLSNDNTECYNCVDCVTGSCGYWCNDNLTCYDTSNNNDAINCVSWSINKDQC